MGGHSTTSTSTSSLERVTETNLQDTGGLTVQGNKGATTIISKSTDAGAVKAGAAVAGAAIGANSDVSLAAIDLGNHAISSGAQVANAGLDNAQAAYQAGLSFGTDALNAVSDLASRNAQQQSDLVANALSGFGSLASQNSASSGTQLQKVALFAIVAAVVIAFAVSQGHR